MAPPIRFTSVAGPYPEVHVRKCWIAATFAVTLFGPVLLATPAAADDESVSGTVVDVLDGDSVLVNLDDGPTIEVRLIGVDAPERYECYYWESREHVEYELLDEDVTLGFDENDESDDLRSFAYVYIDDDIFNRHQIAEGYARQRGYGLDYEYRSWFVSVEQRAHRKNLGLWGECL